MSGTGDVTSQLPQEEKISGEITKIPDEQREAGTKEDIPQKTNEKGKRKNNTRKNKIKFAKTKKSKKNKAGMKKKAKKNNKAANKNLIKVTNDEKEAGTGSTSMPQDAENTINDTQELNLKLVEDVVKNHGGGDVLGSVLMPVEEATKRNPKNDNPELPSKRSLAPTYFILLVLASIIIFLIAGYTYPATEEDVAKNQVFWVIKDGGFDRGLFTQFFASLIFTICVYLLGFYVNSTFIRFGLGGWTIFSAGTYMIFLFGLGKIGELTYNHLVFSTFKNLILPLALIVLAYASYKILKELKGETKNVS